MYTIGWTLEDYIEAVDTGDYLMANFLKHHKGQRIGGICHSIHLHPIGVELIEDKRLYVYEFNGEHYVLARHVAELINYNMRSISKMMKMVSDDNKIKITCGVDEDYRYISRWLISLDGLEELLTRSTKSEAKKCLEEVKEGWYSLQTVVEELVAECK